MKSLDRLHLATLLTISCMLLAISGYVKWFSFFSIDLAVVALAVYTFTLTLYGTKFGASAHLRQDGGLFLSMTMLLVIVLISFYYTAAQTYYFKKLIEYGLLLVIYASVGIAIASTSLRAVMFVFNTIVMLQISYLVYLAWTGDLANSIGLIGEQDMVIDYLAIAELFGIFVLINVGAKNLVINICRVVSVVLMGFTGSRGPLLALGIVYLILWLIKSKGEINYAVVFGIIGFAVAGLLLIDYESLLIYQRLFALLEQGDPSRSAMLEFTYDTIVDSPLIGIGFGAFGILREGTDGKGHPHNMILELWVELGIIGLLVGVTFMVNILSRSIVGVGKSNSHLVLGIYCSIIYIAINAMKSSSLVELRMFIFFVALMMSPLMTRKRVERDDHVSIS